MKGRAGRRNGSQHPVIALGGRDFIDGTGAPRPRIRPPFACPPPKDCDTRQLLFLLARQFGVPVAFPESIHWEDVGFNGPMVESGWPREVWLFPEITRAPNSQDFFEEQELSFSGTSFRRGGLWPSEPTT